MHIVPTSVHHEYLITVGINLLGTRRVRQSRFLLNRQTVHIGPEHDQRPFAIFQQRNNPGTAYIAMHPIAERRQLICQSGRGLMLHRRELGVLVKVEKQVFQFGGVNLTNSITEWRCRVGTALHCQRE